MVKFKIQRFKMIEMELRIKELTRVGLGLSSGQRTYESRNRRVNGLFRVGGKRCLKIC